MLQVETLLRLREKAHLCLGVESSHRSPGEEIQPRVIYGRSDWVIQHSSLALQGCSRSGRHACFSKTQGSESQTSTFKTLLTLLERVIEYGKLCSASLISLSNDT